MKIVGTIKHNYTIKQDLQRWKALLDDMTAFCEDAEEEALASYVRSHESMLRGLNRDFYGLMVSAGLVVLMWADHVESIDTTGMDRREITAELIGAVMRKA